MTSRFRIAPNLALDEKVARLRAAGTAVVHLGFGESRLPLPAEVRDLLVAGTDRRGYGAVAGAEDARAAVAGYFTRRGLPTDPDRIVLAPGSKPLLMALTAVIDGDVVLPDPSWVTYAPQARLFGRRVRPVAIPAEHGGVPDPDLLAETLRAARRAGSAPRLLVLTLPDNPTGTLAPPELVRRVCAVAEREDLLIVSDEIYRDLPHRPQEPFLSPAEILPDRTVVTTGLSKSLALGGWRIGAARFPAGAVGDRLRDGVLAVASEVWSTMPGPMQEVAAGVFAEPPVIVRHLRDSARLHATVTAAMHRIVTDAGAHCRTPGGGFYLYPDFEPARAVLATRGVRDGGALQDHLLEEHGVAVLAGHHFGDAPEALRFRIATSLLSGETDEERWAALRADDPLRLPHVAVVLDRLAEAFQRLVHRPSRHAQ
ncbi:pyridoxal phosphate-dependent aminotransferase [Streptomyces sp. NPDC058770]|uniref:pyridoxal phosphate-dependent aminotransferase n=1 Tax=unclassified Streptomyces TaxID=2593676 RepID=UPI00369148D6